MVESAAAGLDNSILIDNLSFKLRNGAAYVQERKSVSFYASGSNEYTTTGTKLVKLVCTSDSWLDPSTFRISFDVNNKAFDTYTGSGATTAVVPLEAKLLRPLSGPWSFFHRMRILCGGTIVEDISDFARTQEMFSVLMSKGSRVNVDCEGFGLEHFNYKTLQDIASFPGIPGGESQTVMFTPLSGLLSQPKYLPLKYCPLTIELELISSNTEPFVVLGGVFTEANTSTAWSLSNFQIKCDLLNLDNELENGYTQLLMSGKSLPINFSTYVAQYQSILAGTNLGGVAVGQEKVRLNVARSLSRLKSIFITFYAPLRTTNDNLIYKQFNTFYSPMQMTADVPTMGKDGEIEVQVQIGSKCLPEQPIRGHAEAFYNLKKCLGIQSSAVHSFDVNAQEYKRVKFILGFDTEKILAAAFTGENTRNGSLINIKFDQNGDDPTHFAQQMYIILHADCVMEVGDTGVRVYD